MFTWDPCLILRLRCWVNDTYRQSVDSCRAGMAVPSCAFGHDSQPWLHNRVMWGSFEKITESGSHPRPIKSVSWWGPGGTAFALRVLQMELTSAGVETADPRVFAHEFWSTRATEMLVWEGPMLRQLLLCAFGHGMKCSQDKESIALWCTVKQCCSHFRMRTAQHNVFLWGVFNDLVFYSICLPYFDIPFFLSARF